MRVLLYICVFYFVSFNFVKTLEEGTESCDGDDNAKFYECQWCSQTCDRINDQLLCAAICRTPGGCGCKPGFLLNGQGKCVLPDDCPAVNNTSCDGDENAQNYECQWCPQTCSRINNQLFCTAQCKTPGGCGCKQGYLLNDEGKCVLPADCSNQDSRCSSPLLEWSECGAYCQSTCENPDGENPCVDICAPGCVCRKGLVRNATSCIEPKECTNSSMTCPGSNQVLDRCQANGCQNTCDEPGRIAYCDPYGCSFGCICEKGYLKNSDGVCIWAEDCVKCEDPNAAYVNFNATNCQNTCDQPDLSTYCKPEYSDSGCVCNNNFLKSSNGTCLPAESCGVCDDPNAHYSLTLATGCQDNCNNPHFSQVCRPLRAQAGCVCNENLVKNSRNLCIPYDKCNTTLCGVNEHYEDCPNSCPPEDCSAIGRQYKCAAKPAKCEGACKCNVNHKRDARGVCVHIKNCPPLECNGLNEVYNPCPPICPGETCDDAHLNGECPYRIGIALICDPKCRCIEGTFRNSDNVCVDVDQCSVGCNGDPNASNVTCPSPCPKTCTNYDQPTTVCARSCLANGCQCNDGYVLNETTKKCVLPQSCAPNKCGHNRTYRCPTTCGPVTCEDLSRPILCALPDPQQIQSCKRDCYCKEGFLLNRLGHCVPTSSCLAKHSFSIGKLWNHHRNRNSIRRRLW